MIKILQIIVLALTKAGCLICSTWQKLFVFFSIAAYTQHTAFSQINLTLITKADEQISKNVNVFLSIHLQKNLFIHSPPVKADTHTCISGFDLKTSRGFWARITYEGHLADRND